MSFDIATTGLNAITKQMNAISNNIANSGTTGYKSMRAEFSAMYATHATPLGVSVSNTSQSTSISGSIASTGRNLDLAINGNGFFVVRDSGGTTSYTRAGYFGTDNDGYLVNNLGGKLQGYPISDRGILQNGTVSDLQINTGGLPAKSSSTLDFVANLDARTEKPPKAEFDPEDLDTYNNSYTTQLYDSLGRQHTLTQYFVKTDESKWEVHYIVDGDKDNATSSALEFNTHGLLVKPTEPVKIAASTPAPAADKLAIELDYSGTSQYASDFSVTKNKTDGYTSGEKTGQQIDDDGMVYATFSNGQRLLQGQLILANFVNLDGLEATDGTKWLETNSSGAPLMGTPKAGMYGTISSAALESSNVDLTAELVGLMSAQRNYQANTKVISTNDQMMNSLFQAI
ncbi:flagellar hook protein FlgE [Erwinia sorbitola]|uniref:Flagellar hook protein FlgE n=1 Tax=Erwinia sorbitola TaxID=2681984 RepID=A0A6I6ETW2_9GAMM|nr:flagellar hook protein FlgE [Erwinia sorbitola]MTD26956.1 flagellar basal body protein FlaE [Erwinia sorbitola]QGU88519.1 flagellar basal body protein FlaE [Erwinia sorbitola]